MYTIWIFTFVGFLSMQVDELRKKKLEAEQEYRNSMPASSYQQQKLRVCEVCSAYLGIHDNDRRLADHFGGKLHLGFIKIREKLADLEVRTEFSKVRVFNRYQRSFLPRKRLRKGRMKRRRPVRIETETTGMIDTKGDIGNITWAAGNWIGDPNAIVPDLKIVKIEIAKIRAAVPTDRGKFDIVFS